MTTRVGLARGAVSLFLSLVAGRAVSIVSSVVVLHALTPNELGGYSLLLSLQALAITFAGLGLPTGLIRLDPAPGMDRARMWGTGLVLAVAGGLVVSALFFLAAPQFGRFYAAPELEPVLRWAALAIGAQTILTIFFARLQAEHRSVRYAIWTLVTALVNAGAIVVLVLQHGLLGVSAAWALASTVLLAGAALTAGSWIRPRFGRRESLSILIVTTPFFATVLINFLSVVAAKSAATKSADVGILAVIVAGELLAQILLFLPASVGTVFLPAASRLAANDTGRGREASERLTRWLGAVLLPAAVATGFLGNWVLSEITGKSLPGQAAASWIICLAVVPLGVMGPIGPHLIASNRQAEGIPYNLLWGLVLLAGTAIASPRWGGWGYAAAWAAANFVQFVAVVWFARHRLNLRIDVRLTTVALVLLVAGGWALSVRPDAGWTLAVLSLAASVIAVLALRLDAVRELWDLSRAVVGRAFPGPKLAGVADENPPR